jgi:O-antigen biosynthesis protein
LMRIVQRPVVEMVYFDDDVLKVPATARNSKNTRSASSTNYDGADDISETYVRIKPQFKPDFSPDFLLSNNYIGLSFITKTDHMRSLVSGNWQQSLNFPMQLVLGLSQAICAKAPMSAKVNKRRVANSLNRLPAWHDQYPIQHIGQVLRHRDLSKLSGRNSNSNSAYLHETSKAALADGKCLAKSMEQSPASDRSLMLPKVSIIIPTKDQFGILKVCLESLLDKTDYPNYEVVVVDNQTTQASALRYLRALPTRDSRVSVMRYDQPFNYSDINNQAVARCDGEVLLFLNNDVEVLHGKWLREMVRHAVRPEVGCVGAKLLYPDLTIQHAGVALGMHGVADHMYRGMEDCRESDPYGYLSSVRNPAAVTAAVMAVKLSVFEAVGGFDATKFPVAFNDVDLCLKAEMAGFRTVWTPEACLIHHESKTRAPRKVITKKDGQASKLSPTARSKTSKKHIREEHGSVVGSSIVVKVQSHATERSEILHMRKSWGKLLKSKFEVLGQRHETLRFL